MKLVSAKVPPPQPTKPYAMLDSAEMELTLQDLGFATSNRLTQTLMSPDLLTEYASAASMIMDKAEREQVARELLRALQHHPVAA
ncbi:MAG TPA: hypothetical protein VN678_12710 [Acidobacteriaceae bacterium]|nr:hypothetical protein [Acidobacteriaceae bacterium]